MFKEVGWLLLTRHWLVGKAVWAGALRACFLWVVLAEGWAFYIWRWVVALRPRGGIFCRAWRWRVPRLVPVDDTLPQILFGSVTKKTLRNTRVQILVNIKTWFQKNKKLKIKNLELQKNSILQTSPMFQTLSAVHKGKFSHTKGDQKTQLC
jgi:hypothetical protein